MFNIWKVKQTAIEAYGMGFTGGQGRAFQNGVEWAQTG